MKDLIIKSLFNLNLNNQSKGQHMKTFQYKDGKITEGLSITQDPNEKLGKILFLGSAGKGGRFQKLAMDSRNPALDKNGVVKYAGYRHLYINRTNFRRKYTVLNDPSISRDVIMVRVNTSTADNGKSTGKWIPMKGEPKLIADAMGCHNGKTRYADDLVSLKIGDIIMIVPAGRGNKRDILCNDNGHAICMSQSDYKKLTKVKEKTSKDTVVSVNEKESVEKEIEQRHREIDDMSPEEASTELNRIANVDIDPFDIDDPDDSDVVGSTEVEEIANEGDNVVPENAKTDEEVVLTHNKSGESESVV